MRLEEYTRKLKEEFRFNMENIRKYHDYTSNLWDSDFNQDSSGSMELNSVEKSGILAIQHKMLLIYLISVFESLLNDSIYKILEKNFQRFANSDKRQMKYSEIFSEDDLDKIKEKVIRKELLSISYKSIKDQLALLNKDYNFEFIDLDKESNDLEFLIEIYQFRNIQLHNKGVINEIFIQNTRFPKHMLGSAFPIDIDYISDAVTNIDILGERLIKKLEDKYK